MISRTFRIPQHLPPTPWHTQGNRRIRISEEILDDDENVTAVRDLSQAALFMKGDGPEGAAIRALRESMAAAGDLLRRESGIPAIYPEEV